MQGKKEKKWKRQIGRVTQRRLRNEKKEKGKGEEGEKEENLVKETKTRRQKK